MTRKLAIAVAIAAAIGVTAGCKDDKPTPMKFDPSKANYSGQQGGYKGPGQPTQQGSGAGGTTP